ncbi:MAG: IS5 family transposase, partial [Comamonas sp.]
MKARGDLTIWLDKNIQWPAPASGKRGRSHTFSDAAIQFCLSIKCLFGLPLRQSLGLVQSLLSIAGLPWAALDYSTVCRRRKGLDVQVHYRPSGKGLHMLADSTSIKFLAEGEWKTKKHGAKWRHQWRKVHLGIDAGNMQIRAMVVTSDEVGDSPVAAELLAQIPSHEPVVSFTGDGVYDTQDVYEACYHRGAVPVIPPRKGARLRKGLAFAHRNEAVKA